MFAGKRTMTIGLGAVLLVSIPMISFAEGEEEAQVREYFSDVPVMMNIAECESKFTQFGKGGTALRGGMGGKMIGIFQVYGDIHANYAKGLGMDIYTTEGNLAYARHLYEREGTKPWLSSFPCWGSTAGSAEHTSVAPATSSVVLTANLSFGMEHPQILMLQRLLNGNGFALTAQGPGSPGNETERYGSLTRAAVRRFQCAQKIVCDGDEYSSGYGFVGPRTRAALLALKASAGVSAGVQLAPVATSSVSSHSSSGGTNTVNVTADAAQEAAQLQVQIEELTKKLNQMLTEG